MKLYHVNSSMSSWQVAWDNARPRLDNVFQPLSQLTSISRVGQLDTELLDSELVEVLRQPLSKAIGILDVRVFLLLQGKNEFI